MTATPQQPQHMISADDILAGLDPDQRAVATELDGPMRVLAGAGTGKTRAITHRIAYGIAIGRYQGPRVLALTFTLRAAEEMRTRLHQLGAHGVQARTFHSAALRQLAYFWPQVVGGTFPSIVQNKAALITEAANRLRISTDRSLLRDLASLIEWA
ncbi:UvrD-helicase domain-containing protein, partial [Rothia mucilaginosa]